jgi:transcription elongation factor GreA
MKGANHMTKLPMTTVGHSALKQEFMHRLRVQRPRLTERVQQAIADDTNLVENAEYHAVIAEQNLNEARIADLEDKLARAEVIDVAKMSGDVVRFGATVTLTDEDSDETKVWQIVGEPEADANHGKISVASPLARALIGNRQGATVEVDTPAGGKAYKVRQVQWLAGERAA